MADKGALTSNAVCLRETEIQTLLVLSALAAQFCWISPQTLHLPTVTSSTTLWALLGWQEQLIYTMGKPLLKAAVSVPMAAAQSLVERFCWIQLELSLIAAVSSTIQQQSRAEQCIRCTEVMLCLKGKDAHS